MKTALTLIATLCIFLTAQAAHAARGADGHLRIIYWQAPSTMNPYLSGGTKEIEAASLVLEPLARYDQNGNMKPWLAERVPTLENGGVSKDLRTITWKLKGGLKWADGTAVTAKDVVFTWKYCTHPQGGCSQSEKYNDVKSVEALDARTVRVTFGAAKPFPYGPFVGAQAPIIQAAQFAGCLGAKAPRCTDANFKPVGTGPFSVAAFRPNDVISFVANPNYRDPAKPAFARVTFKGGGDAAAAARAVLETGEFDYAWNLQLAPDVLANMKKAGKGVVISSFGTLVERIVVNLTNPAPGLGKERSTAKHPHPFLSDPSVRKALSMAIDRKLLVEIGYGPAGQTDVQRPPRPRHLQVHRQRRRASTKTSPVRQQAARRGGLEARTLTACGARNGVKLSILYQTSTNAVRQDFQALIKQWWSKIGVETELRNISASVFFGGDPASGDTFQKFQADVQMYANNFDGTDPESYMANWACKEAPASRDAVAGQQRAALLRPGLRRAHRPDGARGRA